MVVKYLERFVEEDVPEGFYPSNLGELIERAKEESDEKPSVVMDASSAVSLFCGGLDLSCNGRLKLLRKITEEFVQNVKRSGASLVVFYPGTRDNRDVSVWKEKRIRKIRDVENFFDRLKNGHSAKVEHIQLAAAQRVVKNVFYSLDGCLVRTTLGECVLEVAEYLKNRKGVVFLGQDSDYLIHPEVQIYVSMKSINLKTWECKVYDANKLIEHLKILRDHLPLVATLAGNDVVPNSIVRNFYTKLLGAKAGKVNDRKKIFQVISYFIRGLPCDGDPYANMSLIVSKISDERIGPTLLKASLDSYREKKDPAACPVSAETISQVLRFAREEKKNCKFSSALVSILEKNEWRSGNDLEDFRDADVKPAARITRPLRKRIYGILLQDAEKTSVMEFCVEGVKKKKEYVIEGVLVEAEPPRSRHPGLLRLWSDPHSSETERVKRRLFCEAVDPELEPEETAWIPPKFLFPVLALRHLCRGSGTTELFREAEADVFLVTALKTSEMSAEQLEEIQSEKSPSPRPVRLSSVFLRCCETLQVLNEACGFFVSLLDSCPSNYYDGQLFLHFYWKFESEQNYRDVLGSDTSLSILFRTFSDLIHDTKK